jgi:predicted protein tyrosine phosphatase
MKRSKQNEFDEFGEDAIRAHDFMSSDDACAVIYRQIDNEKAKAAHLGRRRRARPAANVVNIADARARLRGKKLTGGKP